MKIEHDWFLMNSSICFLVFLIAIDIVYNLEEDIKLCDGFLSAGFGLMMSQTVISHKIVFFVGIMISLLKISCQLIKNTKKTIVNGGVDSQNQYVIIDILDEEPHNDLLTAMKIAKHVAILSFVVTSM